MVASDELLRQKATLKTELTNVRRGLLVSIRERKLEEIKLGLETLSTATRAVVSVISDLTRVFGGDRERCANLFVELDKINSEFDEAVDRASVVLDEDGSGRPSGAMTGVNTPRAVNRARNIRAVRAMLEKEFPASATSTIKQEMEDTCEETVPALEGSMEQHPLDGTAWLASLSAGVGSVASTGSSAVPTSTTVAMATPSNRVSYHDPAHVSSRSNDQFGVLQTGGAGMGPPSPNFSSVAMATSSQSRPSVIVTAPSQSVFSQPAIRSTLSATSAPFVPSASWLPPPMPVTMATHAQHVTTPAAPPSLVTNYAGMHASPVLPLTSTPQTVAMATYSSAIPTQPASTCMQPSVTPQQSIPVPVHSMSTPLQPVTMAMHPTNPFSPEYNARVSASGMPGVSSLATQVPASHAAPSDVCKKLQRITVPVFSGEKRKFANWKAAFDVCVHEQALSAQMKLLQLRQYLKGDALKLIESLGYSAAAYEAARKRLDKRYGGDRRQISVYLEELDEFRAVRDNKPKDLEKFADLLEVTMVNLKDVGLEEELGRGTYYRRLQQKLSTSLLARYHRWVADANKSESVETLQEWADREATVQTIASETIDGMTESHTEKRSSTSPRERPPSPQRSVTFYSGGSSSGSACAACGAPHPVWRCTKFQEMPVKQRWSLAKRNALCFRCLGEGHTGRECKRDKECGVNGCTRLHSRLLHGEATAEKSGPPPQNRKAFSALAQERTKGERHQQRSGQMITALRTVPVVLISNGREVAINALLDDASTRSYIADSVAAELGLTGPAIALTVAKLNGQEEEISTMPVECTLKSVDGKMSTPLCACTISKPAGGLQAVDWQRLAASYEHLADIRFPALPNSRQLDLLIGADHPELHQVLEERCGARNTPIARLTCLGWTCIGPVPAERGTCDRPVSTFCTGTNHDLQRLWDIEELDRAAALTMSQEDRNAEALVASTLNTLDGRYCVGIPWKEGRPQMPESHRKALSRLHNLEKRLCKDDSAAAAYQDVISKYLEAGYIRKLSPDEDQRNQWLLPHFAIIRINKETTKTRVVFDAAGVSNGVALNDTISAGPKLQQSLAKVLLRFRKHPVAIVCDIQEMYLQISLLPEDRPYHRFLWRDLQPHRQPDTYEFQRVVFGVNASPFLAQYVARHNAQQHAAVYPRASETVLESTYMDDSMDSVGTVEEGVALVQDLTSLWHEAKMHPRKWVSNSETVLATIPAEDRAKNVNLLRGELPEVKTLGILWSAAEDEFTFQLQLPELEKPTKRRFLSATASLFDPLGFLAPYLIQAKMLLQEMWVSGVAWDAELPPSIVKKIHGWMSQVATLSLVRVQRCLTESNPATAQLHVYSDASEMAYGAVAYLLSGTEDQPNIQFVASKAKVAPVTAYSIPRLELMAATVATSLADTVADALALQREKTVFWTDSMNVLHWVRSYSRSFKQFVASRVGELQRRTSPEQWRYVPTDQNPADLLSRGMSVSELAVSDMWWHGPRYLRRGTSEWPHQPDIKLRVGTAEQKRNKSDSMATDCTAVSVAVDAESWRLDPTRYSDWAKLTRVTAWVHRFLCNAGASAEQRVSGELLPEEVRDAEQSIIRSAQREAMSEYRLVSDGKPVPASSKLSSLQPTIDESGLLRVGGRLQNAEFLTEDQRCPIILPRGHYVTQLIVKWYHEEGYHVSGVSHTLAQLSSRYWLVAGREEVRSWEAKCTMCQRRKARPATQLMAPLPRIRVSLPLRAFAKVSVDCAGPFATKQGRGRARLKRYLCLFTCLLTRAVHLEVLYGMDTDSFLQAYLRFTNRRGTPSEVISDNGTNFVGATRELSDLAQLNTERIRRQTAHHRTRWQFNPPAAPHFGGVHEALIKSAKRAIYAILSRAEVTDEELHSAVTGAEALMNSRPLSYQSADGRDVKPLTPNHFLFGQQGSPFVPAGVDESVNLQQRWRVVQDIVRQVWRRWMEEVVPELNRRLKWRVETPNLKVNDVVLVMSKDSPRGSWPLGRVVQVHPGADGHVRVVQVRVGGKLYTRPVVNLCKLPCEV